MFSCLLKSYATGESFPLDEIVYQDSQGNLLEIEHDIDALKQKSPVEWKQLFEQRASAHTHPFFASGVWGKQEWVLPHLDQSNIVSLGEGWSSLIKPQQFSKQLGLNHLTVKLCGNSHTGSFKDLGMTALASHVQYLRQKGLPIKAVACASTGDTSAALSAYCSAANIPSIVFLPKNKISTAQLIQPISNGAIVLLLDTDFDGCMQIVQQVTQDKSIYLANSMNPFRIEGQKSISIEICQQMGWNVPDNIIIPGGNLGNVSALGFGFDMLLSLGLIHKKPRIIVAQAQNANPLYLAYQNNFKELTPLKAQKTLASAIQIGNPISYQRAIRVLKNYSGIVCQISEAELANAAHLADRSGLYCCPHTGVVLGALIQLVESKEIKPNDNTVVISTAHGLKFSEFKVNYHEQKLPNISSKFANPMIECEADVNAVNRILQSKFSNH